MIKNNILECIGHTPIVKINNLSPNPDVNIYVKIEAFNPSSSVKDRMAIGVIEVENNFFKFMIFTES
jgi:cysteine synthase